MSKVIKVAPYKFSSFDRVPASAPKLPYPLDKAANGEQLNRKEKDLCASLLYGTCSQFDPVYRLLGWAWDFRLVFPRILVKQYDRWSEYYAPDKTSLRKALVGRIIEMVVA